VIVQGTLIFNAQTRYRVGAVDVSRTCMFIYLFCTLFVMIIVRTYYE